MPSDELTRAIATVPAGAWAVGVSGGADSVALLRLAATRADLRLIVVHVDHELRGADSDADAAFVAELAQSLGLPCVVERRSEIERRHVLAEANRSARYRAARQAAFAEAVKTHHLAGVLLAHHRDDQAETICQRLLRGAPVTALAGMSPITTVRGVKIVRPLLAVGRASMRDYLQQIGQSHREDASNLSAKQQRNRVRAWLADRPGVAAALVQLGNASVQWRDWLLDHRPVLPDTFAPRELADLPLPIARSAATAWLSKRGVPVGEAASSSTRLIELAGDAALREINLPSDISVRRVRGLIGVKRTLGKGRHSHAARKKT